MANKILVVDDEDAIREILEFNLENEGYDITCADSAEDALGKLDDKFSLILLDVMMGEMSGYKMAEQLRKKGNNIPIIFITAKDSENDMLTGFSVGGDDFISKPFSIKEVIARIKAILKRERKEDTGPFVFGDLMIDYVYKDVRIKGCKVLLTKTEYEILHLLTENPERLFSRDEIIHNVWKESTYVTERTVDVHIARLRKKLDDYARFISNRSGFGYRFDTTTQ